MHRKWLGNDSTAYVAVTDEPDEEWLAGERRSRPIIGLYFELGDGRANIACLDLIGSMPSELPEALETLAQIREAVDYAEGVARKMMADYATPEAEVDRDFGDFSPDSLSAGPDEPGA